VVPSNYENVVAPTATAAAVATSMYWRLRLNERTNERVWNCSCLYGAVFASQFTRRS